MKLKKLIEERAMKQEALKELLEGVKVEERAMNDEEIGKFDAIEKEIKQIDATINAEERARAIPAKAVKTDESVEVIEERAFDSYIRKAVGAKVEERAGEVNIDMGSNGAIIPTTIANRIIETVKNICPIFAKSTAYAVKGTIKIPVWGKSDTHDITVGYASEFTELTADAGKFTSVDLGGFLIGALSLIGKSVANNAQVNVVDFVVREMAKKIAEFIEKECLVGTTDKCTGALSSTNTKTTASATAITADELIDLQAKVKQPFQKDACWTMNPDTFTAIKKLKDASGRYLLQDNVAGEFPFMLLGKPVYLSDNMPAIAGGAKSVLYGDYSGLSTNMRESIEIQILQEKYATQHAIGVVAWFELDSKVSEADKLAVLVQKAS